MAIRNSEGKLISYECSELIRELEQDFIEFGGDRIVCAIMKDVHGVNMAVDYLLAEEDVEEVGLNDGEATKPMTITALLELFRLENSII